MKNKLKLLIVFIFLSNLAYADELKDSILQVYGAGEKIDDKSYEGLGLKVENDTFKLVGEAGGDYKKASGVYKIDINKLIYSKVGLGYLERELLLNASYKDVEQISGGLAFGYGDNKTYNLEIGHIVNKLNGAYNADGYSRTSYVEALGMYEFDVMGAVDLTGVYKNTHVYSKNHSDYSFDLGYYPMQDIRISAKYDSIDRDSENYVAKAGIEYIFATKEFRPFVSIEKYATKNSSFAFTYSKDIQHKSLKMRDEFENAINTSDIIAQKVAPTKFSQKSQTQNTQSSSNASPTWTQSSYNTGVTVDDSTDADQNILDLTSVSSDAEGDAITYSVVSISVPHSNDQTAWNNSVYIDSGVLKVHNLTTNDPDWDGSVSVVVKASDASGSSNTTVNFTYANFN